MKMLTIQIQDELHAELMRASDMNATSASALVREAIRERLDREISGTGLTPYDFEWHMRFNPKVLALPLDQRMHCAAVERGVFEHQNPRRPEPKKETA